VTHLADIFGSEAARVHGIVGGGASRLRCQIDDRALHSAVYDRVKAITGKGEGP
jgi:hypothetical protein